MDFSWSGKVNARHEAEGYGDPGMVQAHAKTRPKTSLRLHGRNEIGPAPRHGRCAAPQRVEILRPVERESSRRARESIGIRMAITTPVRFRTTSCTDLAGTSPRTEPSSKERFVADERDGPGVVIYPDGRRYTSTWSAGKDINPAGGSCSRKALHDARRGCASLCARWGDSLARALGAATNFT